MLVCWCDSAWCAGVTVPGDVGTAPAGGEAGVRLAGAGSSC